MRRWLRPGILVQSFGSIICALGYRKAIRIVAARKTVMPRAGESIQSTPRLIDSITAVSGILVVRPPVAQSRARRRDDNSNMRSRSRGAMRPRLD